MFDPEQSYFINLPVFVRYKRKFDFARLRSVPWLKSVHLNERIVEIPFAIESLLSMGFRGKVLDVGCSESLLPLFLAGMGFPVTGVDLRTCPYFVPNFRFCQANILKLPFENNTFDAVTCISTLEHIGIDFYSGSEREEDADSKAIFEMARVLKPGGLLVLTVPFGEFFVTSQQRIYDQPKLFQLFKGFEPREVKVYQNQKSAGYVHNFWEEIPFAEGSQAPANKTEMVCLVKAIKCA